MRERPLTENQRRAEHLARLRESEQWVEYYRELGKAGAKDRERQRNTLSKLLSQRVDELNSGRRQPGEFGPDLTYHDPRYALVSTRQDAYERDVKRTTRQWADDSKSRTLEPGDTLSRRLAHVRNLYFGDSRMDERMSNSFPQYRENEQALLDALNVTAVSLRYDITATLVDYRSDYNTAPLAGVGITVTGTLTDKQAGLLREWAQNRFGQLYRNSRPVTPPADPSADVPVTFTSAE